jgi:hypothetical protein
MLPHFSWVNKRLLYPAMAVTSPVHHRLRCSILAQNAGPVSLPLNVKIRFQAFGGAEINAKSVIITYLRRPAINITQRLTPFIRPEGTDVPRCQIAT